MTSLLISIAIALLAANLVLLIVSLRRRVGVDLSPVQQGFDALQKGHERTERTVRDEIATNREEGATAALLAREELAGTLKRFSESLLAGVSEMSASQKAQLDIFSQRLDKLTQSNEQKLTAMRDTVEQRLDSMQRQSSEKLDLQRAAVDDRLKQIQAESGSHSKQMREEVSGSLKRFNDSVIMGMTSMAEGQHKQIETFAGQLGNLTESNQQRLEALRSAVEEKLKQIGEDNTRQLDQMRATVDEKLQGTLEKRLGESFRQVSERLEAVSRGLGEMQTLASGVGDLKRVLSNVKSRGTWGEVQLGAMLEQVLTPEQYAANVATKDGGERVEFAIKLPGRGEDKTDVVWLPIDVKWPEEDYQRLIDAQERADGDAAESAIKQLESRIKSEAKDICEKYLNPPKTTDFAILFLPTEGLFAEVVRRVGLAQFVQQNCRVVIAGPTTLWSILNSLQMGFKTMAIQQRSGEVWNLLASVKTEFSKYGEVLSKVQKKLVEASDTLDKEVAVRTRSINRKLRAVQELPAADLKALPALNGEVVDDGEED
jgi:DNA recombination protein RmuC